MTSEELSSLLVPPTATAPPSLEHDISDQRFGHRITTDNNALKGDYDCIIIGIPQDIGVVRNGGRAGARHAPDTIRQAFYGLADSYCGEQLPSSFRIADYGNMRVEQGDSLETLSNRHYTLVNEALRRSHLVIVLGGGHDCAYPNGRAVAGLGTLGIFNCDAHLDVRPLKNGVAHSGSPFRQLIENSDVRLARQGFVEFGIQPFAAASSHCAYVREHGHTINFLPDIQAKGFASSLQDSWSLMAHAECVYCTLDIDAVASAYAPGVSAPSADGFTPNQLYAIAQTAGNDTRVRLLDIVEVNPTYDIDGRTSKLAAMTLANTLFVRSCSEKKL